MSTVISSRACTPLHTGLVPSNQTALDRLEIANLGLSHIEDIFTDFTWPNIYDALRIVDYEFFNVSGPNPGITSSIFKLKDKFLMLVVIEDIWHITNKNNQNHLPTIANITKKTLIKTLIESKHLFDRGYNIESNKLLVSVDDDSKREAFKININVIFSYHAL